MLLRKVLYFVLLVSLILFSAGCGTAPATPPVVVSEISASSGANIEAGAQVALSITVTGGSPTYQWSATDGTFKGSDTNPAVIYVAPQAAGMVTVTVVVKDSGTTITKNITLTITAPPPPTAAATFTPEPTSTPPPPTPIPPDIACNHPSITQNLFPQLKAVDGQFPMYGPVDNKNFLCRGVYDRFHTGPLAVRIQYTNVGANFGWFGVATPKLYGATQFSKLCFWVYAENPNQAFRLKLKSKVKVGNAYIEKGIVITVDQAGLWAQSCTELSKFAEQGIQLDKLDNFNLGFEQPTGSAAVWVDDFEFVP